MSCNCIKHGKQLWENIKRIMGHKCDYVQVGVWTDKQYVCKPIKECRVCKDKKYEGKDD